MILTFLERTPRLIYASGEARGPSQHGGPFQNSATCRVGGRLEMQENLGPGLPPISIREVQERWAPARPTEVFLTFWRFAAERNSVYLRRLRGEPSPWTSDTILQRFRFTNVFRAADRVSQYLIRKVIYRGEWSSEDTFFRIVLFKIFNRISTWEMLERNLGSVGFSSFQFERYDRLLTASLARGQPIYSAAYIMPPPRGFGRRHKHANHLALLERMMRDGFPWRVARCRSMREVFELFRSYAGVGNFLAYQFTIDLNYSELTDFSEAEFVVPGPGARDGIHKCFSSLGGLGEAELIRLVTDRQDEEFAFLRLPPVTLWGRRLQLTDSQNLFCEVGKYARVAHPGIRGQSHRTRMKQNFRPAGGLTVPWFPPSWGLNERIDDWLVGDDASL